ncbi:MAG TPA: hypothetical protein VFU55_09600 [Terracidiphilus sp.]|nr:hypothetical protein [Terracidiphilus sp.]
MAIAKKSLLGNTSAKSTRFATPVSTKAAVASKMVSPKLTTTKLSTAKMVVGKAGLRTGRAYF